MAEKAVRRCRPLLGTYVEIAAPEAAENAIAAAFAAVARVHALMSFHDEASDLARLRRAPAGCAVEVDPETVEVLRVAETLRRRSDGLFDVAVGARLVASGFLPRPPGIDLREMTGTGADVEILDDRHVLCRRPMLIDLGGIAKGHAVDRAIQALTVAGALPAIVNAGGDLRVAGSEAVTVFLRDAGGVPAASVVVADAALASSSNLHSRRFHRGREVTPHLGRGCAAILTGLTLSAIAPRCIEADAMTKIAMADQALATSMLAEIGGALVAVPPIACAA